MTNENGKTKYYVLMEELKQSILSGEIKPGEKLPSENELSARYQISRHTVRKALSILINEGYIEAEHGRGTFCSQRMGHMKNSRNIAVVTTYKMCIRDRCYGLRGQSKGVRCPEFWHGRYPAGWGQAVFL